MISREPDVEVAIAARRISTGDEIRINADLPFHPASTVKVCIMMEAFRQKQAGIWSLEDSIPITNAFPSLADGSLYSLDPADDSEETLYDAAGQSLPARELILKMITVSSNLATNLLLTRISPRETTDFMAALGSPQLRVLRGMEDKAAYRLGLNNSGTAAGFLNILSGLAKREVASPRDSDEMIEIMSRQQLNEMIPARLPAGTRVAHKTGWIDQNFHDVGIVYPAQAGPFVLAIMTRGFPEKAAGLAHAFVAALARTIYDAWC